MQPSRPQKKCISCNQFPLQSTINLKGGGVIDAECLQQIEAMINSFEDIEEPMQQYYQHIISLVIRCEKCMQIIDGSKKMNVSQSETSPLCSDCKPLPSNRLIKKQEETKTANCIDCGALLSGFTLIAAINIDGLYLCSSCHSGHQNVHGNFKEVEKKEVKIEKKEPYLPIKKSAPINMREYAPNSFSFGKEKRKSQKPKYQEQQCERFADLFDQPIKKQKVQQIKCEICLKFYDASQFNSLNIGVFSSVCCRQCSKIGKNIKGGNKKKEDNQTFGLDCLFQQTPIDIENLNKNEIICQIAFQKPEVKQPLLKPLSNPKIAEQHKMEVPKAVESDKDTQYQLKQCKLCMNSQSKMININCRHLMMCQKCFKEYRKKFKSENVPCPFCSIPGKYQLYIQPLYI